VPAIDQYGAPIKATIVIPIRYSIAE
jgi:hypothetical protein